MLMTYGVLNGSYPSGSGNLETVLSDLIPDYTTSFPKDPSGDSYTYTSDGSTYTITATLSTNQTLSYNPEDGFSQGGGSGGPWYDNSWLNRKAITINSSASLTDYQVKINVTHVPGKMNADFSDLRFTSSDGVTELKYWIESTDTGVVWVKVPSLSSGDNSIYMYYGNPSATTTSNGNDTFPFFDDFSSGSFAANWNVAGSPSINGGIAFCRKGNEIRSKTSWANTYALRTRVHSQEAASNDAGFIGLFTTGTTRSYAYTLYGSYPTSDKINFMLNSGPTAINLGHDGTSPHIYDLLRSGTQCEVRTDGTSKGTLTGGSSASLYIQAAGDGSVNGLGDIYIDWVLFRVYTATEPVISSWGQEESN